MNPLVTVDWLSENLNDPNLVILDASLESNVANIEVKYPNIQIKGARYFDLKGTFSDLENPLPNTLPSPEYFAIEARRLGINKDSKIVVYDNIGIYASPRVWWMFKTMGHESVSVLDGGLPEWGTRKLPIEPIQGKEILEGNFTATFNPNFQKSYAQILENISTEEAIVIDARSKDRFCGLVPETRENLKSGYIPNSVNLPFLRVLNDGKFLPKKEIKAVFKELEMENKPHIYTCGSGLTACILIFASELIGKKDLFLYDGSWTEWGQIDGAPIDK